LAVIIILGGLLAYQNSILRSSLKLRQRSKLLPTLVIAVNKMMIGYKANGKCDQTGTGIESIRNITSREVARYLPS
jgi:hypothetical protein